MENVSAAEMIKDTKSLLEQLTAHESLIKNLSLLQPPDLATKLLDLAASEYHNRELINWRRARSVVEHENNLVNHRVTWLFSSQTVLLSAFGVLYALLAKPSIPLVQEIKVPTLQKCFDSGTIVIPLLLVAALGPFICINIYWQIRSASIQISRVTDWWYEVALAGDSKEQRRKAFDDLNRRHPHLHFWRDTENKIMPLGFVNYYVLRGEALPLYFVALWFGLIFNVVFWFVEPNIWGKIAGALQTYGIPVGGGFLLCLIPTVTYLSLKNRGEISQR